MAPLRTARLEAQVRPYGYSKANNPLRFSSSSFQFELRFPSAPVLLAPQSNLCGCAVNSPGLKLFVTLGEEAVKRFERGLERVATPASLLLILTLSIIPGDTKLLPRHHVIDVQWLPYGLKCNRHQNEG